MKDLLIPSPLMDPEKFREGYTAPAPAEEQAYTVADMAQVFSLTKAQLNRFVGMSSGYSHKKSLRGHLSRLCDKVSDLHAAGNVGAVSLIQDKLEEGIKNCSAGFFNRVQLCFEMITAEADMVALLAMLRNDSLNRARSALGVNEIHAYERFRVVANRVLAARIPVYDRKVRDPYTGRLTDSQIVTATTSAFKERYNPYRIVEDLFLTAFENMGYHGDLSKEEDTYSDGEVLTKIAAFFNATLLGIIPIEYQCLLLMDEEGGPFDIHWAKIISTTINWFFKNRYLLGSKLNFTPVSYYKGSGLKISLDKDCIENTLFVFNTEGAETVQFFLGNARYFSPESRDLYLSSLALDGDQQLQLMRLVALFPEREKKKILARLLLAGFEINAPDLYLKAELKPLITVAQDLERLLVSVSHDRGAIVFNQLADQGGLEVIANKSDFLSVLPSLSVAQQRILLGKMDISHLIKTGEELGVVFAVLKSDELRNFVFLVLEDKLRKMTSSMEKLLHTLMPLNEEQRSFVLGRIDWVNFCTGGSHLDLLAIFRLLKENKNVQQDFFSGVKESIPVFLQSVIHLCDVLACIGDEQADVIWSLLLEQKRLGRLFGSIHNFDYFVGFLDQSILAKKDQMLRDLAGVISEDSSSQALYAALVVSKKLPSVSKELPVFLTQDEFNVFYANCASLLLVDDCLGFVEKFRIVAKQLAPHRHLSVMQLQTKQGLTALMLAARHQPEAIEPLLADLSADQKQAVLQLQNKQGLTALMLAAGYQPEAIEPLLADLSADQKQAVLQLQIKQGSTALMLAAQDQPEAIEPLLADLSADQKQAVLQLQDKKGWTALMVAADHQPEAIEPLLADLSADQKQAVLQLQNKQGWTALMSAARYQPEAIEPLLADLSADQKQAVLQLQDKQGNTALMCAAQYQPEAIEPLLADLSADQKQAVLQLQDKQGLTALMCAARYQPEAIEPLLADLSADQKQAVLQLQDKQGNTALMCAARYQPEAIEPLLADLSADQKQAVLQLQTKQGWTALMCAAQYQPEAIEPLLADLSADQKLSLLEQVVARNCTIEPKGKAAFSYVLLRALLEGTAAMSADIAVTIGFFSGMKDLLKSAYNQHKAELGPVIRDNLNDQGLFYQVVAKHRNEGKSGNTGTLNYFRSRVS